MARKSKKPEKFVRTPGYPGGRKALGEFLGDNIKIPKAAIEAGIQGVVTVQFTLNEAGRVVESSVLQGLGYGCDEEALRVVGLLKFKGVKNRGVRATFKKTIKVPFRYKKKPATSNIQLKYTFKEEENQKPNTITYTIKTGK